MVRSLPSLRAFDLSGGELLGMRPRVIPWLALVVALGAYLGVASSVCAAGPRERVEATVSAIAAILAEPPSTAVDAEERRKQQVRQVIHEAFDFAQMAQASLGPHWAALTSAQRDEFIGIFGELFERSYDRLVLRFLGESQTRYGEESVNEGKTQVHTTLVRKGDDEIPVDYRLSYDGRRWAMADVVVDGVSLAANFRSQFATTLRNSSFDGLVQKIRTKLEQAPAR